jgi:hypothetical protein
LAAFSAVFFYWKIDSRLTLTHANTTETWMKYQASTTPALLPTMDLANLREQPTHHSDLYDKLYQKIQKMTKPELRKRENEIYLNNLSGIHSDRQQIYMELGIIISVLGN